MRRRPIRPDNHLLKEVIRRERREILWREFRSLREELGWLTAALACSAAALALVAR
ncbi:hypothetical protein [Methylococcus capsulatus]|jgi:hypothetical protein|uniref:hypothetical protein n=1 Tax=Methylococcus capsulatus TaxID=414 RepID=UPI001C52A153|nr:hypothetical protein [Methylococcus capsulatus]QXP89477.1 hypothetical protein KW114_10175 [Methylococcus capsulatus]